MHSLPTLILLGILLYVDRIVRQEVIFDSSALTSTVFVTHVLNVCRSKIAHIDPSSSLLLTPAAFDALQPLQTSNYTSQFIDATAAVASTYSVQSSWWWQQQVFLAIYCAASILLLLNLDVSVYAVPPKSSCSPVIPFFLGHAHTATNHQQQLHVSTIVLHCLFVGTLLQIPVGREEFMVPWKIMLRSFVFTSLSICWTYAVGVHEASMHMRNYPYVFNPVLQGAFFFLCACTLSTDDASLVSGRFVQPFTPCQLRFLVLLFLDGYFLAATATVMLCIVGKQLSVLVAQLRITSLDVHASECGFEETQAASHHPYRTLQPKNTLDSKHQPQQLMLAQQQQLSQVLFASPAPTPRYGIGAGRQYSAGQMPSPAAVHCSEQQTMPTSESPEEDEMAAMFRLARCGACVASVWQLNGYLTFLCFLWQESSRL